MLKAEDYQDGDGKQAGDEDFVRLLAFRAPPLHCAPLNDACSTIKLQSACPPHYKGGGGHHSISRGGGGAEGFLK